jgi:hypothetical protein
MAVGASSDGPTKRSQNRPGIESPLTAGEPQRLSTATVVDTVRIEQR